jgi:chloride channel 3/4/5
MFSPTALWRNVFLLTLSAGIKVVFTAWTFGMMACTLINDSATHELILMKVPAGVFLPSIAIGASVGRAMGVFT